MCCGHQFLAVDGVGVESSVLTFVLPETNVVCPQGVHLYALLDYISFLSNLTDWTFVYYLMNPHILIVLIEVCLLYGNYDSQDGGALIGALYRNPHNRIHVR